MFNHMHYLTHNPWAFFALATTIIALLLPVADWITSNNKICKREK